MSSYIVAIVFGAGAFFMFCTFFLLISDSVRFQKSMGAIKKLAQVIKANQEQRKKEIKEFLVHAIGYDADTPTLNETSDEIYDKEIAFYKATMKTLQDKSFSSIENYSVYVESLLMPYYKLRSQVDTQALIDQARNELILETSSTAAQAEVGGAESAESSVVTEAAGDEDIAADNSASSDGVAEDLDSGDKSSLLKTVLEEVFRAYMALFGKESFSKDDLEPEAIRKTVQQMQESGSKPIAGDDDISADDALLEQLKYEKIEYMNRYDGAMLTLNKVYKEYAAAFGMDKGGDHDLTLEQIRSLMGDEPEEGEGEGEGDGGSGADSAASDEGAADEQSATEAQSEEKSEE